jgi:putative ABC transport system substrate-binding protein
MNQRRRSLVTLGAGSFATVLVGELIGGLAAHAQVSAPPVRIGILLAASAMSSATRLAAFMQGMRENGLVEGPHYVVDVSYAQGDNQRFPALVKDLLQRAPAVIMTNSNAATRAAQLATRTVPIVMFTASDPVGTGLVASMAQPGGNTTGLSNQSEDTTAKFVEFVAETLPRAKRIALLVTESPSTSTMSEKVGAAARRAGIETRSVEATTPAALDAAFAAIARLRPDALVVQRNAMLNAETQRISAFALENRIAAFGSDTQFAESGSLLSYGPSRLDMYRRAAYFVDKILKGAKPADLPVEQPTKFELVINLKTAKALGITIPQSLLLRADEVIQ